jgi:hypothetical protein
MNKVYQKPNGHRLRPIFPGSDVLGVDQSPSPMWLMAAPLQIRARDRGRADAHVRADVIEVSPDVTQAQRLRIGRDRDNSGGRDD